MVRSAQSKQKLMWPHGTKMVEIGFSMQIAHFPSFPPCSFGADAEPSSLTGTVIEVICLWKESSSCMSAFSYARSFG